MSILMDQLKSILSGSSGGTRPKPERDTPRRNDKLMERPADAGEGTDKNVVTPDQYGRNKGIMNDKRNIYDDQGNIVDYDLGALKNPLRDVLKGSMMDINSKLGKMINVDSREPGSLIGTFNRFLNPETERTQPGITDVGSATQADLTPPPKLPTQVPKDYSMPGLDPQSLDQLKQSLWQQTGQLAEPLATAGQDPNSLAGRMNNPNAPAEMKQQGKETEDISNSLRPIGNSPIQRPGKTPDTPFSGTKAWLNDGNSNEG